MARDNLVHTQEVETTFEGSEASLGLMGVRSEEVLDKKKKEMLSTVHAIGHFTIRIPVSPVMAPNSKLLFYYIRSDFEVVASTIEFQAKPCFKNKVSMSFDQKEPRPGTKLNLDVTGGPNSTCFVGILDKSVTLLEENDQITPEKLMSQVGNAARPWSYHNYWQEDREYCRTFFNNTDSDMGYDVTGNSAVNSFRDAGMWVLTNGIVKSRPCIEIRHRLYCVKLERRSDLQPSIRAGHEG